MAREKAKSPTDLSVEEKLKNLYSLQVKLTEIDHIKTLRGKLRSAGAAQELIRTHRGLGYALET